MGRQRTEYQLLNYTGHKLYLTNDLDFVILDSRGRVRVKSKQEVDGRVVVNRGPLVMPLLRVSEQEIVGLPERRQGVLYVVSGLVAALANAQGREDVVAPGRTVRSDGNGRVESARALIRIVKG